MDERGWRSRAVCVSQTSDCQRVRQPTRPVAWLKKKKSVGAETETLGAIPEMFRFNQSSFLHAEYH